METYEFQTLMTTTIVFGVTIIGLIGATFVQSRKTYNFIRMKLSFA
jgi:hypothetical protein